MLVGNNLTAKETFKKINEQSKNKKNILFGFQSSGGRREPGRVVSIHAGFSTDSGYLTVGSLDHDETSLVLVKKAFAQTNFKLEVSPDMDAWLKCHAAIVLPICFVVYYCQGDLRKAVWNRVLLNQVIDSMDEALKILQICGITLQPPEMIEYIIKKRANFIRKLQFAAATPIGKLAASDHAMGAKEEMRRLYEDFLRLKEKANIITPHWDELEKYMVK